MRCLKKTVTLVLALVMTVMSFSFGAISVYAAGGWDGTTTTAPEGTGAVADPYKIESAENLAWLSAAVNDPALYASVQGKYFTQTANIDLNGQELCAIGSKYNKLGGVGVFQGVYDGQGYAITNGSFVAQLPADYNTFADYNQEGYAESNGYGAGLFGAAVNSMISNVNIVNVQVGGWTEDPTYTPATQVFSCVYAGAIVGVGRELVIDNCSTDATTLVAAQGTAGGIVGWMTLGTVIGCTNEATVRSEHKSGGVLGAAGGMTVSNCINKGQVEIYRIHQSNNFSGGICGHVLSMDDLPVTFESCINAAPKILIRMVKDRSLRSYGFHYSGGIFSTRDGSGRAQITLRNCFNLMSSYEIIEHQLSSFRYYTAGLTGRPSGHSEGAATIYDGCFSVPVLQTLENKYHGEVDPEKASGEGWTDMPVDYHRSYSTPVDISRFVSPNHASAWAGIMSVGNGLVVNGEPWAAKAEPSVNMTNPEMKLCVMENGTKYGVSAEEIYAMDTYKAAAAPRAEKSQEFIDWVNGVYEAQLQLIAPITEIVFIGIQQSGVAANGQHNIRLLMGVDALTFNTVGFDATVTYKVANGKGEQTTVKKTMNLSTAMVLEQLNANGATVAATSFGKPYVAALELQSPMNTRFGETTIVITPYYTVNNRARYAPQWTLVFDGTGALTSMAPTIA